MDSYHQLAKSLALTIILAILVSGVGHIYLGFIRRGIVILVIGLVLWIVASLHIQYPYMWIITIAYLIWQIIDAYIHYKKFISGQTQTSKFKR
jgi:TM2 domain-containing membrane protein YozV